MSLHKFMTKRKVNLTFLEFRFFIENIDTSNNI